MSNGIRSLPRYQTGGATSSGQDWQNQMDQVKTAAEKQRQRLASISPPRMTFREMEEEGAKRPKIWKLMAEARAERRGAPPERGGIASLIAGIASNPVSSLRRLSSLVLGKDGVDPEVAESIYNAVTPWAGDTDLHMDEITDALGRIARGDPGERHRELTWRGQDVAGLGAVTPAREDAWRTYLELPQESGTFKEAEFLPTRGSGEDIRTFDFADPYRVLDALPYGHRGISMSDSDKRQVVLEELLKDIERADGPVSKLDTFSSGQIRPLAVMGTYSFDKGEDERGPYLSYYDKWDLAPKIAQVSKVGDPFDIYGRMYYDPETYEYLP